MCKIFSPRVEILQLQGPQSSRSRLGALWMSYEEVSTYIKPPRMHSAGAGSEGNTLMVPACYCLCESCHGITGKVRLTSWSDSPGTPWSRGRKWCDSCVDIMLKCLYKPFLCNHRGFYGPQRFVEASALITQPVFDQDQRRDRKP